MAKHVIRVADDVKAAVHALALKKGTTDSEANDWLVRYALARLAALKKDSERKKLGKVAAREAVS